MLRRQGAPSALGSAGGCITNRVPVSQPCMYIANHFSPPVPTAVGDHTLDYRTATTNTSGCGSATRLLRVNHNSVAAFHSA